MVLGDVEDIEDIEWKIEPTLSYLQCVLFGNQIVGAWKEK